VAATSKEEGSRGFVSVGRRVLKGISEDDLSDSAAALTYFAALSIFPALAVVISALALFGSQETVNDLVSAIDDLAPASVTETLSSSLNSLVENKSAGGIALVISLAVSLFSASGYLSGFDRAAARIRGARAAPAWKARPVQMGFALVMVALLAVAVPALLITGEVADAIANAFGISLSAGLFELIKWPLLIVGGMAMIIALYQASPHLRGRLRGLLPGALLAVLLGALGAALFSFYVANLAEYSLTYGSLAGAIVFLIWLYIANLAVLLGAKLNTVLQVADHPGADGTSI
jgi:membrane protein